VEQELLTQAAAEQVLYLSTPAVLMATAATAVLEL
jgi:hypothetical protein